MTETSNPPVYASQTVSLSETIMGAWHCSLHAVLLATRKRRRCHDETPALPPSFPPGHLIETAFRSEVAIVVVAGLSPAMSLVHTSSNFTCCRLLVERAVIGRPMPVHVTVSLAREQSVP